MGGGKGWACAFIVAGRVCFQRYKVSVSGFVPAGWSGVRRTEDHIWLVPIVNLTWDFDDQTYRVGRSTIRSVRPLPIVWGMDHKGLASPTGIWAEYPLVADCFMRAA